MLRISEVYPSVQGEGPRVGKPTVFVRFAGCNLRCPGWPCDTPHAIFPEKYRHEWERSGPTTLVDRITSFGIDNICFTGGEPMLQPFEELIVVERELRAAGYHVEMFSNGTIPYQGFTERIRIIMDWKLPGSGEDSYSKVRFENVERMAKAKLPQAIKFTIADMSDLGEAIDLWKNYVVPHKNLEVFAGVVWGKMENSDLVDHILRHRLPWRLNVQVHNYVWDREKRGI